MVVCFFDRRNPLILCLLVAFFCIAKQHNLSGLFFIFLRFILVYELHERTKNRSQEVLPEIL